MTGAKSSSQQEPEQVQMIAVDALFVSPDNPRKTFDRGELEGMAETIRQGGIRVPLLVRSQGAAAFEIVCGQRRHAAAALAGLDELPCIVREMTDDEACKEALVDNAQRADVPAVEEAVAFGALLDMYGTAEGVAAVVGKDVAHVTRRLKLRSLGISQMDALRERLITVDHALLLAKLGVDEQDQALKWCLDTNAGAKTSVDEVIRKSIGYLHKEDRYRAWEPESAVRLREHIEQSVGRKLSNAPWDLNDAELVPDAGACANCPSNTKANLALFADLDIDEATCADGGCFQVKTSAFVEIQLRAAKAVDKSAVRISWKQSNTAPRAIAAPDEKFLLQVFKDGQWVRAKKGSCTYLHTGVTVDFPQERGYMGSSEDKKKRPGDTFLVCVSMHCKTHAKAYLQKKSDEARRDPAADKAAQEKKAAQAIEESKLRMAVASKAIEAVTALPADALREMAINAVPSWGTAVKVAEALVPGFRKTLATAAIDSVEFARAFAAASLDELVANEYGGPQSGRDNFLKSIKRLGFDGAAAWKKATKPKPTETKKASKKAVKAVAAKPAKKAAKPAKKGISPETRKRIAAAVKKRWAQIPKAKTAPVPFNDDDGGDE